MHLQLVGAFFAFSMPGDWVKGGIHMKVDLMDVRLDDQIYRTAMRLCRMWGVTETLNGDVPPYEPPKAAEILPANERMVME